MAVSLRKVTKEDIDLLYTWVNDPVVRANSFNTNPIKPDEHAAWFQKKLSDSDTEMFIGTDGDTPVGQIRLDIENCVAEVDYSVAPTKRGKGYGTALLREAEKMLPKERVQKWLAQVKPENEASIKAFGRCGYYVTKTTKEYIQLEKERDKRHIVICTAKSWNVENAKALKAAYADAFDITILTKKEELTADNLEKLNPEYVFFPHWSYIIPKSVYEKFTCVVFHMTDLPFGRGGSPLQNLIVRGFKETKISAIKVEEGLDTGDLYGKMPLSLDGTADEILRRASGIIFTEMIPWMLRERPTPTPQTGEAETFKRRKPEDGELLPSMDLQTMYDYIRMLDGEGYPNAFISLGDYALTFSGATLKDGELTAKVTIKRTEESV